MWRESVQKLMQDWSQGMRRRLRAQQQRLPPPTKSIPREVGAAQNGLMNARDSYQRAARAVLDAVKDKVSSSPHYTSAKEYSSQVRKSSQQYASDLSKRLPSEIPTVSTSTWKEMAEPARRAMRESMEAASSSAIRLSRERMAEPAQRALRKSAQRVSESWQSASSQVTSTASRLAQEHVARPAQKVLDGTAQSARRVSESAQQAASQVTEVVSELAKASRRTFLGELRTMRRDIMWGFWWWSLAAIAVYGVATTLPGEVLRLYNHRSLPAKEDKGSREEEENCDSQGEEKVANWFSFGNYKDESAEAESTLSRIRGVFSHLSWPTWQSEKSDDTNAATQKDVKRIGWLTQESGQTTIVGPDGTGPVRVLNDSKDGNFGR